jgi:lipoprotein-anchoring transpeptidase ErfK/SrfK
VQLVVDGTPKAELPALIGRRHKQAVNRHIAGTEAPLPPGTYRIDRSGIATPPYANPELGRGYWIPIAPLFSTGRSALGFHQDPSWGKTNGESGTSGCIGLASPEATAQVVSWIRQYGIRQLSVES